jgi:hypothetical protein
MRTAGAGCVPQQWRARIESAGEHVAHLVAQLETRSMGALTDRVRGDAEHLRRLLAARVVSSDETALTTMIPAMYF